MSSASAKATRNPAARNPDLGQDQADGKVSQPFASATFDTKATIAGAEQLHTEARPLRALVIGYGSPIRGDDALGPLVADRLQERFSVQPQVQVQVQTETAAAAVEVQARHILTAELVEDLARAERVIFIDAAANLPPGKVNCQRLSPDASALSTMAHFHDPRELLAWCQALYHRVPETWLVSAGGAEWGYACYALSEQAQTAVEPMITEVLSLIGAENALEHEPASAQASAPVPN